MKRFSVFAILALIFGPSVNAQNSVWRQATNAELASLLPARAPVIKEHIETEMPTASGIVDGHGRYIAGVVLITAGYSAEGKYSHYLVVQSFIKVGGVALKPGEYVFGYTHSADVLNVHFNEASTGNLVGTTDAHIMAGNRAVTSLHIWPPNSKSVFQIGRFAIPYELKEK
jgi:ammonia channel protein AmtB